MKKRKVRKKLQIGRNATGEDPSNYILPKKNSDFVKHFSLHAKHSHERERVRERFQKNKQQFRDTKIRDTNRVFRERVSRIDVARFNPRLGWKKKKKEEKSQVFPQENTTAKIFDVNARATSHPHKVLKEQSRIGVSSFSFRASIQSPSHHASWYSGIRDPFTDSIL